MSAAAAWFPFYRNWYDQAKLLKKLDRLEFFDTVMALAFEDAEPAPDSFVGKTAVNMVGPVIRKSAARQAAGRAGGKVKQNGSKTEAKRKQSESAPFIKGKGKGKGKEKELSIERGSAPSIEEIVAWATPVHGFSPQPDRAWLEDWRQRMTGGDWRDLDGRDLLGLRACWRRVLTDCWRAEARGSEKGKPLQKNNFPARAEAPAGAEGVAAALADFWPGGVA